MVIREGLTYGDVLIIPKYSDIESRTTIDVTSEYLWKRRLPIISAPMDYVTGYMMAKELDRLTAYGVVSRFGDIGVHNVDEDKFDFALSIGVTSWEPYRDAILTHQPSTVCIDVAHGDHINVIRAIKRVKENFPWISIIAGNVATREGFERLAAAGANAIRVGIGPGSACSTRENTGVGVPQLSAIMDCADRDGWWPDVALIADGGIQTPGDIAKALAAGADAVMLGNMLAGHDESPGEIFFDNDGNGVKVYRGQSLLGSNGIRNAPEGVSGHVPYRGPVEDTINSLMNYLRSSMSYVGARNLHEFRQNAEFIKVSPATFDESRTRL